MFTRRLLLTSLVSLSSLAAGALFVAPVAQAEAPKLIPYGSFKTEYPLGIAVDQSSSDVYVAAILNANINKFDPSGNRISPPSPFGGGSGYYSGTAVNPANGDVYVVSNVYNGVTETFETKIETYVPSSGVLIGTPFGVPGCLNGLSGNFTWSQLATDSAGNVYLACAPENAVRKYSPSGTLLHTFTGSGASALKGPAGVAVDSSGNVWVGDPGNNRVEQFSASGSVIGAFRSEGSLRGGVEALAVDAHDDVYAVVRNSADLCGRLEPPCIHVVEYSAGGAQLADVGAGEIKRGWDEAPNTLAVNDASGRLYVTDSEQGVVWIFGPPTAPAVGRELSAEVTTSEAKLGALVKAGGIQTTYRFEYGTSTAYGQPTPFPEGSVGEGIVSHAVWASANGLAPGTTYHYRVVATNELGTVYGLDQTFTTLTAEQAACPNEQLRGGFSARLPDCRAYELVTTPTKTSVEFGVERGHTAGTPLFATAADGDAISYLASDPLPGAPSGSYRYVAMRGAGGWSSEDIIPLESYAGIFCSINSDSAWAYSDGLSRAVILSGANTRFSGGGQNGGECNAEGLQVVSGEPVGYENLLLRDNTTGTYRLINTPPPGVTPADAHFKGASADLSRVIFSEMAPLTHGAPYGVQDLYEWDEGVLRLLTVLPDGTPVTGSLPAEALAGSHAISAQGSHILFTYGGHLYVRIDGERTVQVDESQGPGTSGGGTFQIATADGSRVLFTDESRLTADSTAAAGEPDLYECALPEGASKCELSDLTVAKGGEHADVLRVSAHGSQDTSHVYFVAKGVLANNTREFTDSEGNKVLEGAQSAQNNLYLWDGTTITFIATLKSGAYEDPGAGQASPDGTWFAFESVRSLTGYDNATPNGPFDEIFLYSAASNELVCASCNPTGEASLHGTHGGAGMGPIGRYLSDGGRLFFQTRDALVPSDTNGQLDVYEYADGHLYLISGGTSPRESTFIDASESGSDVFFLSSQQLVPQDTQEEGQVIYDARVGGGFPAVASPPPCTTADACRTPVSPQPSLYGAPSSQTFSGVGNLAPPETKPKAKPKAKPVKCKKGFVKKKVKGKYRCVRQATRKAKSHKGGK